MTKKTDTSLVKYLSFVFIARCFGLNIVVWIILLYQRRTFPGAFVLFSEGCPAAEVEILEQHEGAAGKEIGLVLDLAEGDALGNVIPDEFADVILELHKSPLAQSEVMQHHAP